MADRKRQAQDPELAAFTPGRDRTVRPSPNNATWKRAGLDPAHVEVIGKVAGAALIFGDVVSDDVEKHRIRGLLNAQAEAILTSTDPDVHAALLAIPAVREALADAWVEGFEAGHETARAANPEYPDSPANPYRTRKQEP